MQFDIDEWMRVLIDKLLMEFDNRVVFVGIQGSRARGEARPDSDIDAVVVLDRLKSFDLVKYREIVATMPHSDLACGFIGSSDILANWTRFDAFTLVMDTKPVYGSLDFMNTSFSSDDAKLSAQVGSQEIYHALCHSILFDEAALDQVLEACVKSSFFIMRALRFAEVGQFPSSRAEMKKVATDWELMFLEAYENMDHFDRDNLANALIEWTGQIITGKPCKSGNAKRIRMD